ncbi:hypothetical protein RRG08_044962 [Elysia crispata]|uniref:Uncharacterized protein n=1 Tax=Elysia crispata TaxID=231223 RepID=A0AAE0ZUT1_9GAST|nr:hypothetical protein RRG08_044962 [Elysia crispata]
MSPSKTCVVSSYMKLCVSNVPSQTVYSLLCLVQGFPTDPQGGRDSQHKLLFKVQTYNLVKTTWMSGQSSRLELCWAVSKGFS